MYAFGLDGGGVHDGAKRGVPAIGEALPGEPETVTIAGLVDVVLTEADSWIPISVERLQRIRSRQRLLRQCTTDGRAERRRRPVTWLRACACCGQPECATRICRRSAGRAWPQTAGQVAIEKVRADIATVEEARVESIAEVLTQQRREQQGGRLRPVVHD